MMIYELAVEDEAKKLELLGVDHMEGFDFCLTSPKRMLCTQEHIRRVLRAIFDNRVKHNPFLVVHIKEPNHIYEGVKIQGWSTEFHDEEKKEVVFFKMGPCQHYHLDVNNIKKVIVL